MKGHNWGLCRLCGKDHGLHPCLGKPCSEETRGKISVANTGIYPSEETRKKLSDAKRGKKHPFYGRHHSEESREKIGEAHRGERNSNFGKPRDEETKVKIGDAQRGEKGHNYGKKGEKSPRYGKHHSEESKNKMSIARKELWVNGVYDERSEKISVADKENWANGVYSGVFTSPTSIEVMLREFLEDNGIPYSTRKVINIGYKTRNPDAFIEPNLIIEADGEYSHSEDCHGVNRKAEDEKADKMMKGMGYIIYRIPELDFRNGKYLETLNMIVAAHHLNPNP